MITHGRTHGRTAEKQNTSGTVFMVADIRGANKGFSEVNLDAFHFSHDFTTSSLWTNEDMMIRYADLLELFLEGPMVSSR